MARPLQTCIFRVVMRWATVRRSLADNRKVSPEAVSTAWSETPSDSLLRAALDASVYEIAYGCDGSTKTYQHFPSVG